MQFKQGSGGHVASSSSGIREVVFCVQENHIIKGSQPCANLQLLCMRCDFVPHREESGEAAKTTEWHTCDG